MITTDKDRYEYSQPGTENYKVFRSDGTDIPVKNAAHINVYVTTTGDFTADFANLYRCSKLSGLYSFVCSYSSNNCFFSFFKKNP